MENFDLKKYLAENKIVNEEFNKSLVSDMDNALIIYLWHL